MAMRTTRATPISRVWATGRESFGWSPVSAANAATSTATISHVSQVMPRLFARAVPFRIDRAWPRSRATSSVSRATAAPTTHGSRSVRSTYCVMCPTFVLFSWQMYSMSSHAGSSLALVCTVNGLAYEPGSTIVMSHDSVLRSVRV